MLVVGLEPTCCLQHRILSPTGCPQPSKQSLLANALASMPSPDLGETRASFASIPPKLPEHYRFRATKTKKASGKTRGTLVLVVGLEPTCCLQHRILSPTGCLQPSKQPLLANATSVFCEYSTQTTRTLPLPSRKNKKSLGQNPRHIGAGGGT